jgi:tungstate transport system ATP-binding protein
MAALFELNQVRQEYGGRTVLSIESLTIEQGLLLGIHGPNGSGKSTLLRILAFVEAPVRGSVRFKGVPADPEGVGIRRRVALLTQSPYLLKRTVLANVTYGLKLRGRKDREEQGRQALSLVGLPPQGYAQRKWYELSGGEAQRVALAARLVLRPEVLLLDEPTANLDEESTEIIRQAAFRARDEWGTDVILVSHDEEWLASVSQRTLRLKKGQLAS